MLLALSLTALWLSGCSGKAPEAREITLSAGDYGVSGADTADDRHCLQLALNAARDLATEETPVAVTLGDGTYYIERGLTVFSHTRLRLSDGAVMILTGQEGCMLYGGSASGETYETLTDVEISGGTWCGGASQSGVQTQLFAFKCASRVTLRDLHMEDSSDHFIMLTGVRDAAVSGCSFRDLLPLPGADHFTKEAVHIDFLPLAEKQLFPSEHITVENCRFDNVASGIGTHHYGYGRSEKKIAVRGCSFGKVAYNCVNAYSMTDLTVSGCTADYCGAFLWCRSTSGSIVGNAIHGTSERCLSVLEGCAVVIRDNRISDVCGESASGKAIALLCGESSCMIEHNDISHIDGVGIRVRGGGSMSTVKGNTVSHANARGIFVSGAVACIEGNAVSDCEGILADSCECDITDNTVEGCLYGIASHCGNVRIARNTVADTEKTGIKVSGTEEARGSAVIEENTVTGSGDADVSIGKHCAGCIVRDNNSECRFRMACSRRSDVVALRNGAEPLPETPFVNCTPEGGHVRLRWQKAADAADYIIYRVDPESDRLQRLAVTEGLHYDTEGLSAGENDLFLVVSRRADGTESFYTYPANAVAVGGGEAAQVLSVGGDSAVEAGREACFFVTSSGSGLRFQWQFMPKGADGWRTWKGMEARFVSALPDTSWEGAQVRCAVTDSAGRTVYSAPISISVKQGVEITTQPETIRAREDDPLLLAVAVGGEGYECRWYFRRAGSRAWECWKGKTEAHFTSVARASWDGMQVKCLVCGRNGEEVFSQPISVSVDAPLRIVSEPADVFAEDGETVRFEIKVAGSGGYTCQWYYQKAGDGEWHIWYGHDTAATSAPANATWNGMKVKCVVTGEAGETVTSREATVSIKG